MAHFDRLASAIYNDVVSGLRGYHHNLSMSIEQLEDDIVDTRLQIIKEYQLKGILSKKDLALAINCIPIDCQDLDRCKCSSKTTGDPIAHFEIPQLFDEDSIQYIGSTDRQIPFVWYTSVNSVFKYSKYRKRGKEKPYVYIDMAPNQNNMYDCFVFNAPYLKEISIEAVFKDPRQLDDFICCADIQEISYINNDIRKRVTDQKIQYYRQLAAPILPNTQEYNAG